MVIISFILLCVLVVIVVGLSALFARKVDDTPQDHSTG